MSKFPIDLSKFKKIASDKGTTTLQHKDGHEIKLAHMQLSPKLRSQLHALPLCEGGMIDDKPAKKMANGGKVSSDDDIISKKSSIDKQNKEAADYGIEPMSYPEDVERKMYETDVTPRKMADGGKVDKDNVEKGLNSIRKAFGNPDPKPTPTKAANYSEGKEVKSKDITVSAKDMEKSSQESGWNPQRWVKNVKEGLGYADGGNVSADSTDSAQSDRPPVTINIGTPNQAAPVPPALAQTSQPNPEAITPTNGASDIAAGQQPYGIKAEDLQKPQAPTNATPTPASTAPNTLAQATPSDPYGVNATGESYGQGLQEEKTGILGQAQAEGNLGKAQAAVLNDQVAQQQEQMKTYQDTVAQLSNERQAFVSDLQNKHIDPNHYLNSLGTGSKISTAIGLILGGIGGGITHSDNPALNFLNAQIDRDIESQKAEIGKSENLLSANLRQFGNMHDAVNMTKVMQMDIVKNQLQEEAAKSSDPMAKYRAIQNIGIIDKAASTIVGQTAMRQSLLSAQGPGKIAPEHVIRMIVPEGQQKDAYKELAESQQMNKAKDNILSAFDKLSQINTIGSRVSSPLQTSKQVAAIKDPLVAGLSKETAGRFTEQDAGMLNSLFPAPGDSPETLATKRVQTNKLISEKMNFPLLNAYGIQPNTAGRFNSAGQSKINFKPQ